MTIEFYVMHCYHNFMQNINWYHSLNKPYLSPPDWIFAPVWTILYITIIISFLLFIKDGLSSKKIIPLILFVIQIILNLIWTPVFFNLQNIKLGFVVLFLLWIFLIFTIKKFYKISKPAGLILIPYLIWTTFALYLNLGILVLN